MASPSIRQDRTGSFPTAIDEKSFPGVSDADREWKEANMIAGPA